MAQPLKFKEGDKLVALTGDAKAEVTGVSLAGDTYSLKVSGAKQVLPITKVESEFKLEGSASPTPTTPNPFTQLTGGGNGGGAAKL